MALLFDAQTEGGGTGEQANLLRQLETRNGIDTKSSRKCSATGVKQIYATYQDIEQATIINQRFEEVNQSQREQAGLPIQNNASTTRSKLAMLRQEKATLIHQLNIQLATDALELVRPEEREEWIRTRHQLSEYANSVIAEANGHLLAGNTAISDRLIKSTLTNSESMVMVCN